MPSLPAAPEKPKAHCKRPSLTGRGLAIGLGIGTILGLTCFHNIAIGVAIGIALAIAFSSTLEPSAPCKKGPDKTPGKASNDN